MHGSKLVDAYEQQLTTNAKDKKNKKDKTIKPLKKLLNKKNMQPIPNCKLTARTVLNW